ncbi:AMP-binding protein [Microbacterium album]|uniref:Acyl-CoA synthetase n=1 Tax=Microbacterium album TaxID=2053191 RepID=A0A917IDD1_9MICO|nr:AMP-binding protein [Microbacterium album]GGH37050.1 acyl-CoA synthetase [Microbacterium album]
MGIRLNYADIWQELARAFPERPAVIGAGEQLTYAGLAARAGALASLLHEDGLRPGDRIAIFMHNRPEYLVTLFAALSRGLTPVPINFRYRASELAALLEDCRPAAVVFAASTAAVIDELPEAARSGVRMWLRVDDEQRPGAPRRDERPFTDIRAHAAALPGRAASDGELFLYTGGTTGRPKAVVWGADDLLDVQLYAIYGAIGLETPSSLADVVRIARDPGTPTPVTMPLAPLMHGTALFNTMNALVLGGTVVLMPTARFDPDVALDLAREHRVSRLILAGDAIAGPLADAADGSPDPALPHLRSVISSGMRFSDPVKARLHALGELAIVDLLASTEGGPYAVATSTSAADLPAPLRLLPGAVVLDDDGAEVQDVPGARGLLAFRGTLPRGYHGDPAKTAEVFRVIRGHRHVVAGDLVEVREDGAIELLGRGSAVVNTGGEKVYPAEVEEALLSHPQVEDAVVFGLPDPRFGESVAAVVAVAEGADVDAATLSAHVDALLAGYKKPRLIDIRRTLERSPSGKVDMRRLQRELGARVPSAR